MTCKNTLPPQRLGWCVDRACTDEQPGERLTNQSLTGIEGPDSEHVLSPVESMEVLNLWRGFALIHVFLSCAHGIKALIY